MNSIKKINGSESGTTKGVNIATEFNKFKDVLFNKKVIRHDNKKHDDKKYVLYDGVNTLAYFHKDCNKKCDKISDNKNKDQ